MTTLEDGFWLDWQGIGEGGWRDDTVVVGLKYMTRHLHHKFACARQRNNSFKRMSRLLIDIHARSNITSSPSRPHYLEDAQACSSS